MNRCIILYLFPTSTHSIGIQIIYFYLEYNLRIKGRDFRKNVKKY